MTWYNYEILIGNFVSDLATKAIAEGWTREEPAYDTIYPSGYPGFKVLFQSLYGSFRGCGNTSTSYAFTYLMVRVAATYDAVNHRPNQAANGHCARFRLIQTGTDYSASMVYKYRVKGWIDSRNIIITVWPDPLLEPNIAAQTIMITEVEAVEELSNSMQLLSSVLEDAYAEVGMNTYDVSSYMSWWGETHFINTLGLSRTWYPYGYGLPVSLSTNKVRAGPIYLWRREYSTDYPGRVDYRVNPDLVRVCACTNEGAETEGDTFTDSGKTYHRTKKMKDDICGKHNLSKPSGGDGTRHDGTFWIRSA